MRRLSGRLPVGQRPPPRTRSRAATSTTTGGTSSTTRARPRASPPATASTTSTGTPRTSRCSKSLGHNAHRLSLEWSRIEPAPGEFSRSRAGALPARAHRARRRRPDRRSSPCTTSPCRAGSPPGAAGSPRTPSRRSRRYCARVAAELGDLMPFVCTINEPQMVALHGYLEGYHPPGITNPTLWKRVGRVLLRGASRRGAGGPRRSARRSRLGLAVQLPLLVARPRRRGLPGAAPRHAARDRRPATSTGSPGPTAATGSACSTTASSGSTRPHPPCSPTRPPGIAADPDGLGGPPGRPAPDAAPRRRDRPAAVRHRERHRHRGRRRTARLPARPTSPRSPRPAPRASTCAATCTGRPSTTSSGARATGPKFGLIAVDHDNDFARIPKPSAYAFARVAETGRLDLLRRSPLS